MLTRSAAAGVALAAVPAAAHAQARPTNLVSVCSGVSLPRSAVTDTIAPVVGGIVQPLQDRSNLLLGLLGGALPLVPPLGIDVAGVLANAAAGAPITLQAVNVNGLLVGPTDACDAQADSINLTTPAGIAIGGNSVTGLGRVGQTASAGTLDAVAIGNRAVTDAGAGAAIAIGTGAAVGPGATGSLALGAGATVIAANGVALGAGSTAGRGNEVSVGTAGAERQITNVAAGTAATDAATLGQVQAVAGQVAALSDRAVQYDGAGRDRVTLAGASGTTLANVAAGTVAAGSTEAVNGGQLFATNQAIAGLQTSVGATSQAVTNNTTAITNLQTSVANGAVGPVRYSNAGTPTTPNGGVPSNDVTLVGATAAPIALHNVANGRIAAGSTDAVNGGQVFALTTTAANAVSYDVDASGGRTNTVTLAGGSAAAPVRVTNVAAGTTTTDAVNLGQLSSGLAGAVGQANAYTDGRIAAIGFDLRRLRRDGYAGTAGALAAAGLPQAYEAGKGMIAIAGGTYMSQSAFAIGFSKAFDDGHTVAKLAGSFDSRGRAGASGGVGYQF